MQQHTRNRVELAVIIPVCKPAGDLGWDAFDDLLLDHDQRGHIHIDVQPAPHAILFSQESLAKTE